MMIQRVEKGVHVECVNYFASYTIIYDLLSIASSSCHLLPNDIERDDKPAPAVRENTLNSLSIVPPFVQRISGNGAGRTKVAPFNEPIEYFEQLVRASSNVEPPIVANDERKPTRVAMAIAPTSSTPRAGRNQTRLDDDGDDNIGESTPDIVVRLPFGAEGDAERAGTMTEVEVDAEGDAERFPLFACPDTTPLLLVLITETRASIFDNILAS